MLNKDDKDHIKNAIISKCLPDFKEGDEFATSLYGSIINIVIAGIEEYDRLNISKRDK